MRFGSAVPNPAMVGLMLVLAGCGSQNATPKVAESPAPLMTGQSANVAGAAGAPQAAALDDYPDPSKLLKSYQSTNPGVPGENGKPSKSGLRMEVRESGPGQQWLLHIVNHGEQAAELVADTRLLWFEVKLPGQKKQSLCKLPEPLGGTGQPEVRLVVHLEPGEGVADQFDPRLYCFADGDQKLLVPGAEITPHFGWVEAPPKKLWKRGKRVEEPVLQKPPFVARQSLETDVPPKQAKQPGQVATPTAVARLTRAGVSGADKQLTGAPLELKSEYAVWTRQSVPAAAQTSSPEPALPPPTLGLRLVQGSDAKAEHDATIQLSIVNQSPLPTYVYFRREMISFEVAGPAGITQCPGRIDDRTPERSAFLHLTRNAQRSYACRVAELCPRGTFANPGLYLVYARFDATLSGQEQGLEAFVGPVYSPKPATIRIRTGEQPIFQKRPMLRTTEGQPEGAAGTGTP